MASGSREALTIGATFSGISSRTPQNRPQISPPYKDSLTPYRNENQKPRDSEPAGVSSKRVEEGGRILLPPTIKDVKREDLEQFSRCSELYRQAVEAGWIAGSEAQRLNWFAAACRAKSSKTVQDPVRTFVGIVRRGLWEHITQADEERARAAVNKYGR